MDILGTKSNSGLSRVTARTHQIEGGNIDGNFKAK
jgi:hypothetical protein